LSQNFAVGVSAPGPKMLKRTLILTSSTKKKQNPKLSDYFFSKLEDYPHLWMV